MYPHSFIEESNNQLIAAFASKGIQIRILNKSDGYRKWWERIVMRLARLFNPDVDSFITVFTSGKEARIYWSAGRPFSATSIFDHATLRHEAVHVLQAMRLGKLFGPFLFALLYLFALPAVFTMRAKYEQEAYLETLRVYQEYGVSHVQKIRAMDRWAKLFRDSSYFWMDPVWGGGFRRGSDLRAQILYHGAPGPSPLEAIGYKPLAPFFDQES